MYHSTNTATLLAPITVDEDETAEEFFDRISNWLADPEPTTPATPAYTEVTSAQDCLEHLLLVMESKIMRKFEELEAKLNSFSLKQMKRKRTGSSRCKALNRKGEICNGYVCKNKSRHLCYAHYVLIDKQKENAGYLYSKK